MKEKIYPNIGLSKEVRNGKMADSIITRKVFNRRPISTGKEKVMKVGFAVQVNEGVESKVYDHFGSAPAFIIVDTEGRDVLTVNNKDLHHVHGACNPIMALDGKSVDAMIVGGIGAGALTKLNALGIRVYEAGAPTVKENLVLLSESKLQELSVYNSCRAHQGECGDSQGHKN
jgi:predicted Fe-Mo cluster-binding NifX family protein